MIASFKPGRARGQTTAPPSKSMAHRLLICAGLSAGQSRVENVDLSEDISATLDCLRSLGAGLEQEEESVSVRGVGGRRPGPLPGLLPAPLSDLPCRECGSTLRFFIPICLLSAGQARLCGSRRLFSRPLSVYEDICAAQGLTFIKTADSLTLQGPLSGGDFAFAADISSQFVSGLLLALPLLSQDSRLRLLPPLESRPYIDMTMQALEMFGVKVGWDQGGTILIPGGQTYAPARVRVEGDYSNAAVFQALDLLGGQVTVSGLDPDSRQGDRISSEYFRRLAQGPATLDIADCPDLGPVLMAVAAACQGCILTGARRLRLKESDRAHAMQEELRKFGARVEVKENSVIVHPGPLHAPRTMLKGHNDHRIVMALALLAARYGGAICGVEAVKKSLPDFFHRLRALGLEVKTDGMDKQG